MKNLLFIILIFLLACKKDDEVDNCSSIGTYSDTITAGAYKLWLITTVNTDGGGLEVVDKNNQNINNSADFAVNYVQFRNGDKCWETDLVTSAIGSSSNVFASRFAGTPSWGIDPNTKIIIKLSVAGTPHYLIDEHLNN